MTVGQRHAPIFFFDSREGFRPVAVESVEAVPGAKLVNPDGSPGGRLALDALPAQGGRMDFPDHPERVEGEMERAFGKVGYLRRVAGGSLDWHQYWLWYLYNPKGLFLPGAHEGDWEFVQIGFVGDTPVCMTASQHRSGGSRMWWDVSTHGGRPKVYVALGSHANYFSPPNEIPDIGDEGDGAGEVLDEIEWREFGSWATWPGRWGNSTGKGKSPRSPGCQGDRWSEPHCYHSKARIEP